MFVTLSRRRLRGFLFFFFNDTATTEIYTLSLHDALPISWRDSGLGGDDAPELDAERVGVALASGIGGVQTLLANYDALLAKGPRRGSPLAIPMLMPNGPAAHIGLRIEIGRASCRGRG